MVANSLVILYGVGGLSDVGRHAVQAALERTDVELVTILTQYPDMLWDQTNWKCGCETPHSFSNADKERMNVVTVKSWQEDDIFPHFRGATAVVSCLGHRQPFMRKYCVSAEGNEAIIKAMKQTENLKRVVVCSSPGIEEDWPPMEFFKLGKYAMMGIFMSIGNASFRDLSQMERAYKATEDKDIDYLLIRPVGLSEDVRPVNAWALQRKKYEDVLHFEMAKLDCARYMVEEAVKPTRHREAVVIGANKPEDEQRNK